MMQNVHKHHCIKTGIGIRDFTPVKFFNRYMGLRSHHHINALDCEITALFHDLLRYQPVTAAYIQNGRIVWQ